MVPRLLAEATGKTELVLNEKRRLEGGVLGEDEEFVWDMCSLRFPCVQVMILKRHLER